MYDIIIIEKDNFFKVINVIFCHTSHMQRWINEAQINKIIFTKNDFHLKKWRLNLAR